MKNRTGIDFRDHELLITEQEGLLIHYLKKPDTICQSIKYINTNGIMAVTGDYGNWIFCREFHPTGEGGVSDQYWCEKLRIHSNQKDKDFNTELTVKQLWYGISKGLKEWGYEGEKLNQAKEFYSECIQHCDSEWEYVAFAHGYNKPSFIDHEEVPFVETIKPQLQVVFDGFDEICKRLNEEIPVLTYK